MMRKKLWNISPKNINFVTGLVFLPLYPLVARQSVHRMTVWLFTSMYKQIFHSGYLRIYMCVGLRFRNCTLEREVFFCWQAQGWSHVTLAKHAWHMLSVKTVFSSGTCPTLFSALWTIPTCMSSLARIFPCYWLEWLFQEWVQEWS